MNKFKKFVLATMLGLAISAPAVGMVGCSKLGPEPNVPEQEDPQENPQEQTQVYSAEKVKADFVEQLLNLHERAFEKIKPEICDLVKEFSDIDSKITVAEAEISEIAEWSVGPTVVSGGWEADEEHQARLEELKSLIETLQEQRADVEDRLDEYYLEHGDDDLDRIAQIASWIEGFNHLPNELELLKNFELNKVYIEEGSNGFWGLFEIDKDTLVMLRPSWFTKIEYKDGKLIRVSDYYNDSVEHEGDVKVVDFEKQAIYDAGISKNQLEDSPFRLFNDGKLGFADMQEILNNWTFGAVYIDFSTENILHEFEGDLPSLLDCLNVLQNANIKLPTSDFLDELYKSVPAAQYPLNSFGGFFAYDDFEIKESEIESELQALSNVVFGAATPNDLQILRIPKFAFNKSVAVGEDASRPGAAYSVYRQVGSADILLPVDLNLPFLYSMKVFKGLPTGEVQFEYFNGRLEAGARRYDGCEILNLTEDYADQILAWLDQIFEALNHLQETNTLRYPVEMYYDDDNTPIYRMGINHFAGAGYELSFAIMVDEEGNEQLVLIPISNVIEVE